MDSFDSLQSSHKSVHRPQGDPVLLSDRILFIDAAAIVIDKPAGLPVDTPRRGGDSIASKLDELRCGFRRMPTPMHRLDTDTSGCLLLARTPKARAELQQAFETRAAEKYYLAVIGCEIAEDHGLIDIPLSKTSSAEAGWRMVADGNGHEAITRWRRLSVRDGSTLVEFRPLTGRTHQIRVHAREAFGCGIAGDRVYGSSARSPIRGMGEHGDGGPMLLHASRLVVPRSKASIDVTAPLPDYFGEWADAA
jgi:tRNA pseudouridine32 synthase/23S rRNA pseudouridine746 synthase